jgi:hypothetical protein
MFHSQMNNHNQSWVLRQNYGTKTNQSDMRELIMTQKFVTCPWGGWGVHRQNVIDGIYNDRMPIQVGRSSRGQDRRFVEEMAIGDIVVIPFVGTKECIIAKITSDVEYAIESGLKWKEENGQIQLGDNNGLPFQPVGRRIEIIRDSFIPAKSFGPMTLCKLNRLLLLPHSS